MLLHIQNQAAFLTFLTAGFPAKDDTPELLMALERGGADVIELGMPFSDPQADGPAIQESNRIALQQGVDYAMCLKYIKEARSRGLKAVSYTHLRAHET